MKPVLKGIVAVVVVAGLMFWAWSQYRDFLHRGQLPPSSTQALNTIEQNGVPQFTLPTLSGEQVSLSQFAGKVVIVNFWASWCDPCVEEFPSFLQLIKGYKGEVKLLAISADKDKSDIENFLRAFKADIPDLVVLWDKDQTVAKSFGTMVLPESYILDREHKLVRKIAGVDDWTNPYAISFFDRLLGLKE